MWFSQVGRVPESTFFVKLLHHNLMAIRNYCKFWWIGGQFVSMRTISFIHFCMICLMVMFRIGLGVHLLIFVFQRIVHYHRIHDVWIHTKLPSHKIVTFFSCDRVKLSLALSHDSCQTSQMHYRVKPYCMQLKCFNMTFEVQTTSAITVCKILMHSQWFPVNLHNE